MNRMRKNALEYETYESANKNNQNIQNSTKPATPRDPAVLHLSCNFFKPKACPADPSNPAVKRLSCRFLKKVSDPPYTATAPVGMGIGNYFWWGVHAAHPSWSSYNTRGTAGGTTSEGEDTVPPIKVSGPPYTSTAPVGSFWSPSLPVQLKYMGDRWP